MYRKAVLPLATFLASLSFLGASSAATRYVDASVPGSGDGSSWQTAFKTIQEGMDAASDGDTVLVAPGTYLENIHFHGKNIVLTSTGPLDPDIVGSTIIDGRWRGSVVTFSGEEHESCTLSGFTIRHGRAGWGGGILGGSWSARTLAAIRSNVITANAALDSLLSPSSPGPGSMTTLPLHYGYGGGGIAFSAGVIEGNTVSQNLAEYGGALYFCDGTIRNNAITGNLASEQGGGLRQCHGTIRGNLISGNLGYDGGGGLCGCDGIIENNTILDNYADTDGGGLRECHGIIRYNEVIGNVARRSGGGFHACQATIESNTISKNAGSRGGGLDSCGGDILSNIVSDNSAVEPRYSGSGGGLYDCDGRVDGNRITGNMASDRGAGLYGCDGEILNNIIASNGGGDSPRSGGGLDHCDGNILNNVIVRNFAESAGGGLLMCHGTIQNNTIYGNIATSGSGLDACRGTIRNCIISANICEPQIHNSATATYSCIEGWSGQGEGNIPPYPHFVDLAGGDFHLHSWSPCIDAGDPDLPFSIEPEPNGGRINIGAYGNTPEAAAKSADSDADGLPDDWETHWFGDLGNDAASDPDGDHIPNAMEVHYGSDPACVLELRVNNLAKSKLYSTIQAALFDADDGDEIALSPGVYWENLKFGGKSVVLRSLDPQDPDTVASTIIDGNQTGPIITLSGEEKDPCSIKGLTLRNGKGHCGGAICGGTRYKHSHATIRNNIIINNSSHDGGAISWCDGAIQDNVISGNIATLYGGGTYQCGGTVERNTISDNLAHDGAGLSHCDAVIQNNIIVRNFAQPTFLRTGASGGGLAFCDGSIRNNIIATNSADGSGGGLDGCDGLVENNTIAFNQASWGGGGLAWCGGMIRNCIIWGNQAEGDEQLYGSSVPTYSCIQNWTGGSEGNVAGDPQFTDPDGADEDPLTFEDNDYRLSDGSPCIDAGKNQEWMRRALDLDSKPRILLGDNTMTVDMGAYEYGSCAFVVTHIRRSVDAGLELIWSSRPGDVYVIWSCDGPACEDWFGLTTLPSQGSLTSWVDPSGVAAPKKFYRIELRK